jgi:uncharacterized membrane protein YbhN (UPF0104 family)
MLPAVPPEEASAAPLTVPSSTALARRAIGLVVLLVILGLTISVLPGLGEVRERFGRADPVWIVLTFASSLCSRLSYIAALRGTLSRQISWRGAWNLGMAEQGSNVLLPTGGVGGPALGAIVLRRAGVPSTVAAPRSAALFLLTSATSFAAIALAGILTGIGLLRSDVHWVGTLLPAALAVALMSAVVALGHLPVGHGSENERRVRRWARQAGTLLRGGVRESIALVRARDPLVVGGCIGYLAFDVAALGASFQAFGGGGPPVYGSSAAPATAAVLAYRVFQLGLPAILGVLAFRQIRKRLGDAEQTAAVAARFGSGPP